MKKAFLFVITMAGLIFASLSGVSAHSITSDALPQPGLHEQMPAGLYTLDKKHSSLTWKVSHFGLSNYTARFTRFDAELMLDPQTPENSTLTANIDPTSIETDYPKTTQSDFNKELAEKKEFFNTGAFPEITFVSKNIKRVGTNKGTVTGDLTFLGITKPLTLEVTFNNAFPEHPLNKKPTLGFSAVGVLKRSDFGMEVYIPAIGDEVTLLIEAEFVYDN